MKLLLLSLLLPVSTLADDLRVHVDGAGCRTRQLAIQRIWEKLPGVTEVEILSAAEAPAPNQRHFVIRSASKAPTKQQLIQALGRRAKHYRVLKVTPLPAAAPAQSRRSAR